MSDLRHFPQYVLEHGSHLWRVHREANGPWYFRSDGTFRFDLCNRDGYGTCYFAEQPLGAFVEALQNFRMVALPRAEVTARRLFRLPVKHALVLADLLDNRAGTFGADASLGAGKADDYYESQALASHLFDAGFAGVRYHVRNDLSQRLVGVALFGPSGPQPQILQGEDLPIGEDVIADACRDLSFRTRGPLLDPV